MPDYEALNRQLKELDKKLDKETAIRCRELREHSEKLHEQVEENLRITRADERRERDLARAILDKRMKKAPTKRNLPFLVRLWNQLRYGAAMIRWLWSMPTFVWMYEQGMDKQSRRLVINRWHEANPGPQRQDYGLTDDTNA